MLAPLTIAIIEESLALLRPHGARFRNNFHLRLSRLSPELAQLVGEDPEQEEHILQMLGCLREPARLTDPCNRMGLRHAEHGVTPDDYASIGSALLATLGELLGGKFTAEQEDAWATLYAWFALQWEIAGESAQLQPPASGTDARQNRNSHPRTQSKESTVIS